MLDSADANASLVYRFDRFEVDEARYTFKIDGSSVPLTGKPWQLLLLLLKRSPSAVNRREILDIVWAGREVTDGVLTQAVSRLRTALSDHDQMLIHTVHGIGFALKAAVTFSQRDVVLINDGPVAISRATRLPGHHAWQLLEPMTIGGRSAVWLAEHRSTHERRVFKFAIDAPSLASLKRELAVSRLLEDTETASHCVPVLEWNLSTAPYYIVLPHIEGQTLDEWCLASAPTLPEKLELLACIADTLAGVHRAGVVHADLKPRNILVQSDLEHRSRAFLVDFGSSAVQDMERLRTLSVSIAATDASPGSGGTLLYIAPEVLAGGPASPASDVYSLGVILYQLLIVRFDQPIGPGWEGAIANELLRIDIRDFCHVDLSLRDASAEHFAQRLRSLPARTAALAQTRATEERLASYRQLLARRQLYGWAALLLVLCSAVAGWGWINAERHRQAASLAQSETEEVMHYLLDKVFFSTDGPNGGRKEITVVEALANIETSVDVDLADQPAARARVLRRLVVTYSGLNDLTRASRISRRALSDPTLVMSDSDRDQFRYNLAENLRLNGHNIESLALFEKLAEARSIIDEPLDHAIVLLNIAATHIALGHYNIGREYAARAALVQHLPLEVQGNIQNGADQAQGMALGFMGQINQAQAYFAKIAERTQADAQLDPSLMAQRGQAWVCFWNKDYPGAVALQRAAWASMQKSMLRTRQERFARLALAEFLLSAKQPAEIRALLKPLIPDPVPEQFDLSLAGRAYTLMAAAELALNNAEKAAGLLGHAEALIVEADSLQSESYRRWLLQKAALPDSSAIDWHTQAQALQERLHKL